VFFSIATQPDFRFDNRVEHLGLWINFDQGWQVTQQELYKGYSSNHCRLVLEHNGVCITHSEPRSFPVWFKHGFISNLYCGLDKQAFVRDHLHMDPDGRIVWTPRDLDLSVPSDTITMDQALNLICDRLDTAVQDLKQHDHPPLRLFCSGGLDTFLIYAMLKHHQVEFELLSTEHFETDDFTTHNQPALDHYWSYRQQQLHHWNHPAWLVTGGCGDEYFLRGPAVIAMLTAWHDIDFQSLLQANCSQYHYHHFNKYQQLWQTSWQQRQQLQCQYPTRQQLLQQIMDNLANDHQHWHLGHTITWTPLKDIEIARILLQLDMDDLVPQFLDGAVTKRVIEHYCAPVLDFVSTYKNHNTQEHLSEFLRWHHA